MKAIGVKMVELIAMTAAEALAKGYRVNSKSGDAPGYEVTYDGGYKSWSPKEVADAAYFVLDEKNDGTKILKEDVDKFLTNHVSYTVGPKTTVVLATTVTNFDFVDSSACVDPKNYSQELGEQYALENIKNNLWSYLGFVLQWAKNGIKNNK